MGVPHMGVGWPAMIIVYPRMLAMLTPHKVEQLAPQKNGAWKEDPFPIEAR